MKKKIYKEGYMRFVNESTIHDNNVYFYFVVYFRFNILILFLYKTMRCGIIDNG